MSRFAAFGNDLYTGRRSIDFVGRQRLWYAISGGIIVLALIGIFGRGLNFGLEFRGGSEFRVPGRHAHPGLRADRPLGAQQRGERRGRGGHQARHLHGPGADREAQRRRRPRPARPSWPRRSASPRTSITSSFVGASWGSSVSDKARNALVVFLVLVSLVLAAVLPHLEDVARGAGRPAARPRHHRRHLRPRRVRDHAGVGDRLPHHPRLLALRHRRGVRQGAREHQRSGRERADDLLARRPTSRSTRPWSARSTRPSSRCCRSAAILVVGFTVLGPGTLLDLALALFVGIAVGTYSSIFIATPMLADLREREPAMRQLRKRAERYQATRTRAAQEAGPGTASPARPPAPGTDRPQDAVPAARAAGTPRASSRSAGPPATPSRTAQPAAASPQVQAIGGTSRR